MKENKFDWPRIRDLPKAEQEAFLKELSGQTVPLVEGVPMKEQDFYYPWDYERWKAGRGNSVDLD